MNLQHKKKKGPVWKKPQQKKKGGKKAGKGKQKPKQKLKAVETTSSTAAGSETKETEDKDWARFQRGVNKREKALSGKSRVSHSVHCPYFTDDKQEYWWVYICDRKTHSLITPPYHLTNL